MINTWLKKIDQTNSSNLILYIVAASILLAAWMQHIQHGWINSDSVLYFEQARLYTLGDWAGIMGVYEWPLYGILIGLVHQLTSLNIHQSAQLLNMLFFGTATASFLYLIKLTGGSSRTILMGALLLFSSQYIVGDVLEMLLRDEGFWAFYLSALVFFIRFAQHQKVWDALLWQACIILATLFRIEGFFYLSLLPLLYFLLCPTPLKTNLYLALKAYSLSIVISISIVVLLILNPETNMSLFGRLNEIFSNDLLTKLTTQSSIMAEDVLGSDLDEFALVGLLLTFIYVVIAKIVSATGLISTALSILGIRQQLRNRPTIPLYILTITVIISVLAAVVIIIKVFVLSGRYLIPASWLLLVLASFYLTKLSKSPQTKIRILFIILCIAICLGFIKNILPKRDGYNYRQEAVAWAKTMNSNHQSIFYDDSRMIYFANAPFLGKWENNWATALSVLEREKLNSYEMLLISHSKKHPEYLTFIQEKLPELQEVKRFYNSKKKKFVVVYSYKK